MFAVYKGEIVIIVMPAVYFLERLIVAAIANMRSVFFAGLSGREWLR